MAEYPTPGTAPEWMAGIERRLAALERAPRLTNASISDDAGRTRVSLGRLDPDADDYGLVVYDENETVTFWADGRGTIYPQQQWGLRQAGLYIPITGAAFAPVWQVVTSYTTTDAMRLQVYVSADTATTGEVRLSCNVGGTPVSATVPIPALFGDYVEWKWAIPGVIPGTGPIEVAVEARRTSGAGAINVYQPAQAVSIDSILAGATPTGL